MELFFETYLIISLLFALFTICIAGIFLKNKKTAIGLGALTVVLGFIFPWFLIVFQKALGSLGEIDRLIFLGGRTIEEVIDELRHTFDISRPLVAIAFDYFTHNLGFIMLSIAIGIICGILIHLLVRKQMRVR